MLLYFSFIFKHFLNKWFELLQLRMEVGNGGVLLPLTMEALLCLKQGNSSRYIAYSFK